MSSTNLNINKIISEKNQKSNSINSNLQIEYEKSAKTKANDELSKNSETNNNYNDTLTLYSGNSSLEISRDYSRLSEEDYQLPKKIKKVHFNILKILQMEVNIQEVQIYHIKKNIILHIQE